MSTAVGDYPDDTPWLRSSIISFSTILWTIGISLVITVPIAAAWAAGWVELASKGVPDFLILGVIYVVAWLVTLLAMTVLLNRDRKVLAVMAVHRGLKFELASSAPELVPWEDLLRASSEPKDRWVRLTYRCRDGTGTEGFFLLSHYQFEGVARHPLFPARIHH
ncbi:MAG: hypothetical protein ACHQ2Y_00100 [Candidatus Lutacidiplasmatales archaeon]